MIFLAKGGKITGPFTTEQFNQFKHSGELDRFSWYWDARGADWKPIDPAPLSAPEMPHEMPPEISKDAHARPPSDELSQRRAQVVPPKPTPSRQPSTARASRVEILVHDFKSVATAKIRHISELGCEIVVPAGGAHSAPFSEKASVMLNLYDPSSEESMDIAASIHGLTHESEGLVYRIRWSDAPELLFRPSASA
jgi:hypothetical protein